MALPALDIRSPPRPAWPCPNCKAALVDKWHAGYQAACQGCQVRALAKSKAYADSMKLGFITPVYRASLGRLFAGAPEIAHAQVKAEAERLKEMS